MNQKASQMERRIQKNPVKFWPLLPLVVRDCGAVDTVPFYSHCEPSTVKTVVVVCGDMIITVPGLEIVLGKEITDFFGAFFSLSVF